MQETNLIQQDQRVGVIVGPAPAPAPSMTLCSYGSKLTRDELSRVETPAATATQKPIPHISVVEKLIEALGFRQIGVVREEYAVSSDGMKMFGVMVSFAKLWRSNGMRSLGRSRTLAVG